MEILIYLVQASLSLAGFAGLYALLLQKETYYRWNRWFFWMAGIASLAIPAWNEWLSQEETLQQVTTYVPDLSFHYEALQQTQSRYPSIEVILLGIWIIGMLVMSFRLTGQFIGVYQLYKDSSLSSINEQPILIPSQETAPFSFFRWIFMNPAQFTSHELTEVLLHEQVHAEQGHSWDVMMGEVLQVVFWFNPLVNWWVKVIRQNLEYLADNGVLTHGLNARHYQYHLLRQSGLAVPVRTYFNVSELKNRIRQINTPSSAPWKSAKLLLIFPLLAFWVMAFTPRQVLEEITINTIVAAPVKVPGKSFQVDSVVTQKKTAGKRKITPKRKAASPEEEAKTEYYLNDEKVSKKAIEKVDTDEIKSVDVIKAPSGQGNGVDKVKISLRNRSIESGEARQSTVKTPIYIVDGKEIADLTGIEPEDIKEIHVLKGNSAIEQYGTKAKDGVVLVITNPKN